MEKLVGSLVKIRSLVSQGYGYILKLNNELNTIDIFHMDDNKKWKMNNYSQNQISLSVEKGEVIIFITYYYNPQIQPVPGIYPNTSVGNPWIITTNGTNTGGTTIIPNTITTTGNWTLAGNTAIAGTTINSNIVASSF